MTARDRCAPGSLVSHPEMAKGCLIRDFEPCLPSLDGKQGARPLHIERLKSKPRAALGDVSLAVPSRGRLFLRGRVCRASRAAVLRRNEQTRFSSASDDEVGGFRAR